MARVRDTEVLVVGAGPVGLFAAVSLAERGVAVEIIDEAWRPATHGYALALHPGSLDLLSEVGVAEELIAVGQRVERVGFYEGSERQAELDLGTVDGSHPMVVSLPQRSLESQLQERLRALKVTVRWNHRLSDLEAEDDHVVATIDRLDRVSGGYPVASMKEVVVASHAIKARYVIGADGHMSLVRKKLGAQMERVGQASEFAVFEFSADFQDPHEMRVVLDGECSSGLWPLADGRCRFSFELPEGAEALGMSERRQVTRIGQHSFPEIATDRLVELVVARAPWFEAQIDQVLWSIAVGFERRLASSFGNGRVWLAGDAAHVLFPIGMHSMNLGLQEASQLAAVMAGGLRGQESTDALESYGRDAARRANLVLTKGGDLVARAEAGDWVKQRREQIVECIPAGGDQLLQLLKQLGLEPTSRA
jgi:2-polyprenyl-6-methoxyphenol hydroxylase-like FAD-dependent oxidoreductase